MAKNNQDEYIRVYYGININTREVQSVWVTRGGKMSCGSHSHTIMPSRNIISEMMVVFEIADTISFQPADIQHDHAKVQIEQLKVRADEMKKE